MRNRPAKPRDWFRRVAAIGVSLPEVENATKYDGSPVLKVRGCFLAGLAIHASAEPETLVVRCDPEDRPHLLADAPGTYYVTDYYQPHPVVLVRLTTIDDDALRDLLTVSWRMALGKAKTKAKSKHALLSER